MGEPPQTTKPQPQTSYQPHIDGLRAIAVVAVILFHAHTPLFGGGYLGVDIFFVISGFLITVNIAGNLRDGTFSLKTFYLRRARRILPALLLVLLCSSVAAYLILTPDQLSGYVNTVLANLVFLTNFLFTRNTDYFSSPAELSPLIHTWSLAVEEQFYLFYPALLLLAFWLWRRLRLPVAWLLGGLAALSLALGLLLQNRYTNATFYLMPTRGWELLAGALAALFVAWVGSNGLALERLRRWAGPLFGLGLALIVVSVVTASGRFPDPASVAAVLGAALVIVAGRLTPLGAALSGRPTVLIGLMSYSLYLWHQPIFAFMRAYFPSPPSTAQYLGGIAATAGLAYLSWRFVEVPFRNGRAVSVRALLASLGAGAALLGGFGLAGHFGDGLPGRLNPAARLALAAESNTNPRSDACRSTLANPLPLNRGCVYPLPTTPGIRAEVLLAGDSHAGALAYSLGQALEPRGWHARSLLLYGCAPLLLNTPKFNPQERQCVAHQKELVDYVRRSDARVVVLFNRWSSYFKGVYVNPAGGAEVSDGPGNFYRSGVGAGQMVASYTDLIGQLLATGKTVVLVYPVPDMGWNVPNTLYKNAAFGFQTQVNSRLSDYAARNAEVLGAFDGLSSLALRRVRPADLFCVADGGQVCVSQLDGQILYFDDDHLNLSGASRLAGAIVRALPSAQ